LLSEPKVSATEFSKSALYISISWHGSEGVVNNRLHISWSHGHITYIEVCLGETKSVVRCSRKRAQVGFDAYIVPWSNFTYNCSIELPLRICIDIYQNTWSIMQSKGGGRGHSAADVAESFTQSCIHEYCWKGSNSKALEHWNSQKLPDLYSNKNNLLVVIWRAGPHSGACKSEAVSILFMYLSQDF